MLHLFSARSLIDFDNLDSLIGVGASQNALTMSGSQSQSTSKSSSASLMLTRKSGKNTWVNKVRKLTVIIQRVKVLLVILVFIKKGNVDNQKKSE